MKIAVSCIENKGIESQISYVFGRCPYFVIVEIDKKEIKKSKVIENIAVSQLSGAGITAAQLVANEGVEVVISGAIGPRAYQVFQKIGIKIFRGINGSVKQNIEAYLNGKLKEIVVPGGMGFGMRRRFRGRF